MRQDFDLLAKQAWAHAFLSVSLNLDRSLEPEPRLVQPTSSKTPTFLPITFSRFFQVACLGTVMVTAFFAYKNLYIALVRKIYPEQDM